MQSPVLAIAWEIWGARRRGFLWLLAALAACALGYRLGAVVLEHSDFWRGMAYFLMVSSLVVAHALLNFTENGSRERFNGFPSRLFTKPVGTHLLVLCPLLLGIAAVAMLYAFWALVVYPLAGIHTLPAWPASYLITGMIWFQTSIWALAGFRRTRIITISVIFTCLLGFAIVSHVPEVKGTLPSWLQHLVLVCLDVLGVVTALITVEQQRHGGGRAPGWIAKWVETAVDAVPRRRRSFHSAQSAQFWLEWRGSGFVLPGAIAFLMVAVVGPIFWLGGRDPAVVFYTLAWCLFLPIVLSLMVGFGFGRADFWSVSGKLSPFIAVRPISTGDLVFTKLKVAAGSAAVAWLIVLTCAAAWLFLFCERDSLNQFANEVRLYALWGSLTRAQPPLVQRPLILFALLGAFLLTWIMLIGHLWIGLLGLSGFIKFAYEMSVALLFLVAVPFTIWLVAHPQVFPTFSERLQHLPWGVIVWFLLALLVVKIAVGAWVWRETVRRKLLGPHAAWSFLLIWLLGTICFSTLPLLLMTSAGVREVGLVMSLLMVPVVRVGLAPLTLSANRHR